MGNIIIQDSPIAGKGVFAARDFKAGEVVVCWDMSHVLSEQEVQALPAGERKHVTFVDGKHVLMQSPARYVNHSCDANTTVQNFCDVATRNIKVGEEIFGNYAEVMDADESMICQCGSEKCRHVIRGLSQTMNVL